MGQDKKISELTTFPTTLSGSEEVVLVQSGTTYKGTIADFRNYILNLDLETNQGVILKTAGKSLAFKSGTNTRAGNATLVGGTILVINASVTTNTIVLMNKKTLGGISGNLSYTVLNGTSFTINSSNANDTSTVSYLLIESI